jgi:16S rRNA (cytosine1402-N4)-methyltransferase
MINLTGFGFEQSIQEMDENSVSHLPVMLVEVAHYLVAQQGGGFVECTRGLGGHAEAVLKLIGPEGRLIGIDRDAESLRMARERLRPYLPQCDFAQEDFRDIDKVLQELKVDKVDGILLDLGISSFQLDNPQRGFSFQADGPLDMRMDQNGRLSAFDLVNSLSEKEISLILRTYGEERWHNRIARTIVTQRAKNAIETTQELSQIILRAIPCHQRKGRIHAATRTFQAFRIAVNRELESLEIVMGKCVGLLKDHGRIVVISFHSLEDRIVKQKFRCLAKEEKIHLITKKPLRPGETESERNPRARSARVRVAERILNI